MLIKAGVDIHRLSPEVRPFLGAAQEVMEPENDELVVTSTYEGNHLPYSYHYADDAFDFEGRYHLNSAYAIRMQGRMPDYVDVVYEEDHVHVEFDRRKYNKQKGIT